MNILEHKIIEVIKEEELPEELVDMTGIPGFEGNSQVKLGKRWEVTYRYDCYGQLGITKKTYMTKEEYQRDLDRGYFEA